MKICCISDTHSMHNKVTLPEADVIVHAGDSTNVGRSSEILEFLNWYSSLNYKHKILIAGNHDWGFDKEHERFKKECDDKGIIYLNDTNVVVDGIKFHGSPIQPGFCDWAFNRRVNESTSFDVGSMCRKVHDIIQPHWDLIPSDTDVLITHGPPKGIMDASIHDGKLCGCPLLLDKVKEIEPKLHIFGHIHNWHGTEKIGNTLFINASICTERYEPINKPIIVEILNEK